MFLKILMLVFQVRLKSVLLFTIFYVKDSTVCSDCHDVVIMSVDINSIVFLSIHGVDYRYIIFGL